MHVLLFVLLFLLPLGAWIFLPAIRGVRFLRDPGIPPEDRAEALARRDQVLASLRDIEMDRRMGKMTEADYLAVRAQVEAEAVGILDALEGKPTPASGDGRDSSR